MATASAAASTVRFLVRLPRPSATSRSPWPALVPPSWRPASAAAAAGGSRLASSVAGALSSARDEDDDEGGDAAGRQRHGRRWQLGEVTAATAAGAPPGLARPPAVVAATAGARAASRESGLPALRRAAATTTAAARGGSSEWVLRHRRLGGRAPGTQTLAVSVPVGAGIVRRAASSSPPGGAPADGGQAVAASSSSSPSSSSSTTVAVGGDASQITWRKALKSPRAAALYVRASGVALVEWGRHFWAASKLLAADVRGSWKILKRLIKGKTLTRRERNFLIGTGSDLARLVPFSLFLIIPFMEFALPFALRLFPNMLPSQFQDAMKAEENLKRQLKVKIELAKYLRDVVEEKARVLKSSSSAGESVRADAEALTTFLASIRDGKPVDPADVNRFARLFSDEITLEGSVRPQLVAMCKYMGLSPYGADPFLRFKIRNRLNSISKDDMQIVWEGGVDRLTEDEVARACRDRGIRTVGVSHRWRARQLKDWLEMSQNREIPASLMILSRAFLFSDVSEALGSLPEGVIDDVKSQSAGELTSAERLEEVRRQRKLIEAEEEREARAEAEKAAEKEKKEAAAAAAAAAEAEAKAAAAPGGDAPADVDAAAAPAAGDGDLLSDEELAKKVAADADRASAAEPAAAPDAAAEADAKPPKAAAADKASAAAAAAAREGARPEAAPPTPEEPKEEDSRLSAEERKVAQEEAISRIAMSLGDLSSTSAVESERLELESLKAELAAAESTIRSSTAEGGAEEGAAAAAAAADGSAPAAAAPAVETPPADGPELRRLRKLVKNLERDVQRVDSKVGLKLKLLDADNDGVISLEEATAGLAVLAGDVDEEAIRETLRRLDADEDGNFNRGDLRRLMKELQDGGSTPSSSASASAGGK